MHPTSISRDMSSTSSRAPKQANSRTRRPMIARPGALGAGRKRLASVLILVCFVSWLSNPVAAEGIDFGANRLVRTAPRPVCIEAADINGDGWPDLIVGEAQAPALALFIGRGDGHFVFQSRHDIGRAPVALHVVDLDLDGRLDAVVVREKSKDIAIFRGDDAGGFAGATRIRMPGVPTTVAIAHLDDDGYLDLIAAAGNKIGIALSDGEGGFADEAGSLTLPETIRAVRLADADHDGNVDLWLAGATACWLYPGNGKGGLGRGRPIERSPIARDIAAVDMNWDGHLDLLASKADDGALTIQNGNGEGGFSSPRTIDIGDSPLSFALTDFDRDSMPDVLVMPEAGRGVTLLRGDGDGGLEPARNMGVGRAPGPAAIADFDRDELPDIAILCRDEATVEITLREGRTHILYPNRLPAAIEPTHVVAGDFDGDARDDIVVARNDGISAFYGDGQGRFSTPQRVAFAIRPSTMEAADLNGDGLAELVIGGVGSAPMHVLVRNENGYGDPQRIDNQTGADAIAIGDFIAGAAPEVAVFRPSVGTVTLLSVRPSTREAARRSGDSSKGTNLRDSDDVGDLEFTAEAAMPVSTSPSPMVAGDFDGDGALDLALTVTGPDGIVVLRGDGKGGFKMVTTLVNNLEATAIAAADLNGDEHLDLAIAATRGGAIFFGVGDGMFRPGTALVQDGGPDDLGTVRAIVPADYDENGTTDLALIADRGVRVLALTAAAAIDSIRDFAAGTLPADAAVGRFHASRRHDLAVASRGDESVFLFRNRTFDALDTRRGNVDAGNGEIRNVLTVNGSTGSGAERVVNVSAGGDFKLEIATPPSLGDKPAGFALYVWEGEPDPRTVRRLPGAVGRTAMGTPIEAPFAVQPSRLVNRLGIARRFGTTRWPVPAPAAAPATVAGDLEGFPSRSMYIQGLILDPGSLSGTMAVTNGIVVRIVD